MRRRENATRLLRFRYRLPQADVCDRCGQVCDAPCGADDLRERTLDNALRLAIRLR